MEIIQGWFAYIIMDNTPQSFLFATLLSIVGLLLWIGQRKDDGFDLRDIICSWTGGKQVVSTSKTLLAGAFLTSSYYVIQNTSDTSFAAYLLAWVSNGGIAAWKQTKINDAKQKKEEE